MGPPNLCSVLSIRRKLLPLFVAVVIVLPSAFGSSELGGTCTPELFFKPYANDRSKFYACEPVENQIWPMKVGTWTLKNCPGGDHEEFIEQLQSCKNRDKFRKQYSQCQQNPMMPGCFPQQPCIAPNTNVGVGSPCSWMTAPLAQNPNNPSSFLQCTPAQPADPCGSWQQMPCNQGTQFNANLQICVQANVQNTCGQNMAPVCGCQQQQQQQVCPGTSTCQQGTCCQPTQMQPQVPIVFPNQPQIQPQVPIIFPQQQQMPVCPGTNMQAVSSCASGCQSGMSCQSGGCCPLPMCPTTGNQAISGCSGGCPGGYGCFQGGCCQQSPSLPSPSVPIVFPQQSMLPLPSCPSGQPSYGMCQGNQGCGFGMSCQQGACCPPPISQPQQQCGGCQQQPLPQCCPQPALQQIQQQGQCCGQSQQQQVPIVFPQQPAVQGVVMPLPQCPQGGMAQMPCSQGCGAGMNCYQGGCCPQAQPQVPIVYPQQQPQPQQMCCNQPIQQPVLPTCPQGNLAVSPCSGAGGCSSGFNCMQGGCCQQPLPMCPTGQPAIQSCDRGCPPGCSCYNGGCCRMPTCPTTGTPAQNFCGSSCSNNQANVCVQGGCCPAPIPQCPGGMPGSQRCGGPGQCSVGQGCFNGACCPMSPCSSGMVPAQECGVGGVCPMGAACNNGGCCPVPMCSNNQVAIQACGVGGGCPSGFGCQQNSCCPQPLPTCPNGVPSIQMCGNGIQCPEGYGCARGGCCLLDRTQQQCPAQQQPVCQCATNNMCPTGLGCSQGTCCAGASVSVYGTQFPGAPCQQSTQCAGFSGGSASCQQGYCQCQQNCWSNGVSCVQQPMAQWSPRASCGQQFNAPCKIRFSATKRKPVLEAEVDEKAIPVFFRTIANVSRVCENHNTCTPEELCVKNRCVKRMVPGEYGCVYNDQCSFDCENSYCDKQAKSAYLWQCRCKRGYAFVELGLCYKKCPAGTVARGGRCKVIKTNRDFWENEEVHQSLMSSHSCGVEKFYRV